MKGSDKWFLYSIPPYVIIGLANAIYKWGDSMLISLAWILYLLVGVIYFKLWR